MALQADFYKQVFHFSFDARTSRGTMREKISWFIKVWDTSAPDKTGVGECGPLPGLSIDHRPELEEEIRTFIQKFNQASVAQPGDASLPALHAFIQESLGDSITKYPSLIFAFETALLDLLNGGTRLIFSNSFATGTPIPINGLIWMGGLDFMLQQIEIKIRDGFTCLKLKVGGLDFEKECDVLQYIRRKYFREKITIRLDANGAFKTEEALYKLNELARFEVHSIEQPIKAGLPELEELCRKSPIPVALDEELIGVKTQAEKEALLTRVRPQHIIIKPTLHGGFSSATEWIELAGRHGIGWWITSALESNVGLNAIAQFTAQYPVSIPQGLGTGMLYTDNIDSPLTVNKGLLSYDKSLEWGSFGQ